MNSAGTDTTTGMGSGSPVWLRARRYANIFVCYISSDEINWLQLEAPHVIGMGPTTLVGMSVMSDNQRLAQVKFDNITLTPQGSPLPSPWLQQDIGGAYGSGDGAYSSSVFTVASVASAFQQASSDSVHYIYQPASGNLDVITRVLGSSRTELVAQWLAS